MYPTHTNPLLEISYVPTNAVNHGCLGPHASRPTSMFIITQKNQSAQANLFTRPTPPQTLDKIIVWSIILMRQVDIEITE